MAGSQLKRLKASLREQGITGPQKSKKQRRKLAQDDRSRNEKRLQRGVVLEGIREQFNPFDLKHAARGTKFDVTTNRPSTENGSIRGRPGLARAAGEEKRRETLLVDMQRRNKVGGIIDRRFGENDPSMAPEEKMLERFAREKQRAHKKSAMFDLEDDEPMGGLTHMGQALRFEDEELVDDFREDDLEGDDDEDAEDTRETRLKRLRAIISAGIEEGTEEGQPERKKTKKEVMEEVIAKSKLHKYERQAAKEDDDELRHQLNKELPNIQLLLSSSLKGAQRSENDANVVSTIAGVDRDAFDKNFDLQVKKLAEDRRAKPSDRTKTEEEKAEEESNKLKRLEEKRLKRMRGEEVSDSEQDESEEEKDNDRKDEMDMAEDDDEDFGLGRGIKTRPTATELGFDDEDDFFIEDDLVASGSDLEPLESSDEDDDDGDDDDEKDDENSKEIDEEDDEFTKGLLNEEEARNPVFHTESSSSKDKGNDEHGLPFTFTCAQTCAELIAITKSYPHAHLPKIVQRIRALYHPKLDSKNKELLANFAVSLVDFIVSPWDPKTSPPFAVLESLIRHIHSLSKSFPLEISRRFREHISEMGEERPIALSPSDLILLTAVGAIFPTSDHFHQVVTPAMLTIARYLGQKAPQNLAEYAMGTYLSILSLQYQKLSKRYVPEVVNFALNTICALAPASPTTQMGRFPIHEPVTGTRCREASSIQPRRLNFSDCLFSRLSRDEATSLKVALLDTCIQVIDTAAEIWIGKSSFLETFDQCVNVLGFLKPKACRAHMPAALSGRADKVSEKLERMCRVSQLSRRNLELHHHRPLAIKTYIPKFEETFDPDKHYDPDRERADLAKLKAEHKRERKGALRELRKDANFMAREKLRIKKTKDEAYEKKYKRIIAEIQNEEGREANAYEREAKARKRAKTRR